MVKPLESRAQSLGEFNIRAGSNTVFQQKAQNLAALNSTFQELTDPLAESYLAGEAEGARLAKYNAEKDLPVELIPADEGGFNPLSLTKWGRAYDESYNELDAQLVNFQAQEALAKQAQELGRPENQGPGITQRFESQAAEIVRAYTSTATRANQSKVYTQLTERARNLQFQLAQTEQAYAFSQTKSRLDEITNSLERDLTDVTLGPPEGREALIHDISKQLESNINAQANLNIIPHAKAEAMKADIARNARKNILTGKFLDAESMGKGDEFRASLITNPPDGYTPTEILESMTDMQKIQNAHASAQKDYLELKRTQDAIINNEAPSLPKATVSKLYNDVQDANRQLLGDAGGTLTPLARSQSLLGFEGVYPVSGIPGKSLGTNVPEFDNLVGGMLTSGDLEQMVQGAQVYNQHINVAKQPNTLQLDNDEALIAASISAAVNSGADPLLAAEQARKNILDKTNPVAQYRASEFDDGKFQDSLPRAFKQAFGAGLSDFSNDEAFATFKILYRQNYISGGSKQSAIDATAYQMSNWGKSDYFPEGKVLQRPPEDTAIYKSGFSFDNQMRYRLQEIIDANPAIKWANKDFKIDLNNLTDAEKALAPLDMKNAGKLPKVIVQSAYGPTETDAYLWSDASVDYSNNGNPKYALVYKDRFGNIQPIMDETGTMQAYFNPAPLAQWAPEVARSESLKASLELSKEIYFAPGNQALEAFNTSPLFSGSFNSKMKDLTKAMMRMEKTSPEAISGQLFGQPDEAVQ